MRKKLVIANWKMNPDTGTKARTMFRAIKDKTKNLKRTQVVICPPLVYLESLGSIPSHRNCTIGAQDAFWAHEGAFTGQVSADMIHNAKARYVIVGHSERREAGDTDEIINKKVMSVIESSLVPIICVGEKSRDADMRYIHDIKIQLKEAIAGLAKDQLMKVIVAYEPVWAISTNKGHACTPADCRDVIHVIRQIFADVLGSTELARKIPVLYGGSVHVNNIEAFITEGTIDGVLVGRDSLNVKDFIKIIIATEKTPI